MQRAYSALYLHVSTPLLRLQLASSAPYLRTSTSLHLQRASRVPSLHASASLHLQRAARHPDLYIATPAARQWQEDLHNTLYSKLRIFLILDRPDSHIGCEEDCNIAQEMAYGLEQVNKESRGRRENTKQRQQARKNV